ncbi:MAG: 2-amino-4-hydroxy-6-hydroxymethyldihydropteridine diphosphokinase [Chloroflexota bacterium]|nr:2-amino-4-hydroxy-6-hydroxymethyldihydropteridine diphosphokinase [Chloroflexota bacterium]MDE2949444.1 2-amino-4-hydroxy-6-hydroxymethyldihydropteridine diphosphokinase [Chloroflexota bacterium]
MDIIEIKNLRLQTTIGFSAHELDRLQEVVISIRIETDGRRAGETDDPDDVFNYKTVNKAVISLVKESRFRLLEKLAEEIAKTVVVRFAARRVQVKIHKPGALRHADSVGITIERRAEDYKRNAVFLSLGSNISPEKNIAAAIKLLRRHTNVLALSSVYRTAPQGDPHQDAFINMAVKLHTLRKPIEFKTQVIDRIESRLRRTRDPNNRNAPRTIDIDVSLWNDEAFEFGDRPWIVPDPDILRYAHVAIPLADIAADSCHPTQGVTLSEIAAGFSAAGVQRIEIDFEPWEK